MSQTKAIVDKLLTNVSQMLKPDGMISEDVLPILKSKQTSGKLAKYGNKHLQLVNTVAGGRGAYRRAETIVRSQSTYTIDNHGIEGLVTPDDYRNVELPYRAEEDEVLGLTTTLWLEKENALASTLSNAAILTQNTTLAGTAQFNDYANSDPLAQFKAARLAIRNGCGLPPDTAIMDWAVANTLAYHPGILDALGYSKNRAGQLSPDELAKAMGVQRLLIAKPVYNSAKEGQPDSLAAVWGKGIIFGVMPTKAMPYQKSLGYYIVYEGEGPRKVYKYVVNNPPESTGIIVQDSYVFAIADANCGYLIANAIA